MNSLRELQENCYQAFVLGATDALVPQVRDNEIAAKDRIQVYENNARETYRKTLLASYPVVARLGGEECFRGLALKYMREQPSRCGDLQKFGANFPGFLHALYAASDFAYLPDVARLEWALEEVHLEPIEKIINVSDLAQVATEDHPRLSFQIRRGLHLVSSRYPILSIWRANQPGEDADVDLSVGGEHVAVLRRGDDLEMHPLNDASYALLSQLAGGSTLESAFDRLRSHSPDDSDDEADSALAAALNSVMSLGLLSGFSVAEPPIPAT